MASRQKEDEQAVVRLRSGRRSLFPIARTAWQTPVAVLLALLLVCLVQLVLNAAQGGAGNRVLLKPRASGARDAPEVRLLPASEGMTR